MKESQLEQRFNQELILNFDGKTYKFSITQIIILLLGTPLIALLLYFFLQLKINYWIYEFTSIQISFILNSLLGMNSQVIIDPEHNIFPSIFIPDHPFNQNYAITTNCIAAHVFSIIISLVLLIPSSQTSLSKKDFILRKVKTLFITVLGIYLMNIFRIAFLLFFNYKGVPFEFIHESLFFLSAILGSWLTVILLKKWLPEVFISIYYLYRLISKKKRTDA
ncbi:MAG: hypothetical protein ACFFDX_14000 [Candidatus Odinarchaeota archaeon]